MRRNGNEHLDPERITVSLVDGNDLAPHERDHLEHCRECSEARMLLAGKLDALSEQAARFTPETNLKVHLPASEPASPTTWLIKWPVGAVAVLATVMLVIALTLPYYYPGKSLNSTKTSLARQMTLDEMVVSGIQQIDENPLVTAYAEILPSTSSMVGDDAFDYMDPIETMPNGLPDVMDI